MGPTTACIESITEFAPDVVVVDHYGVEDAISVSMPVIRFTDMPSTSIRASLIVNMAGKSCDHPQAPTVSGPAWACLRSEFIPQSERPRQGSVITIGGTDPLALAAKLRSELPEPVEILHGQSAASVAAAFRGAAVGVVSASTVAWEALACGLPIVAIETVPNQRAMAALLLHAGVPVCTPATYDVQSLLRDACCPSTIRPDGLGAQRLAARIRENIYPLNELCAATWGDAENLLAIANDSLVREVSFVNDKITWPDHKVWLEARLADPECRIWLADEGRATIRLALQGGTAMVSLAMLPESRGHGLGARLLAEVQDWCRKTSFTRVLDAWVRDGNESSLRLFGRAGFSVALREGNATLLRWRAA